MWQTIINFFAQPPPALDPVFIPWLTALIAGNIIIATGVWALMKYIAKITPWAQDDKIIQIITGGLAAVKGAVSRKDTVTSEEDES
jgi:hypothetical protein